MKRESLLPRLLCAALVVLTVGCGETVGRVGTAGMGGIAGMGGTAGTSGYHCPHSCV